jgi:hypothetical protein
MTSKRLKGPKETNKKAVLKLISLDKRGLTPCRWVKRGYEAIKEADRSAV